MNEQITIKKSGIIYAKIAAVVYVLWGILHLYSAKQVFDLAQSIGEGMVKGRVLQDAYNLVFFALFGIVVGCIFVWKNNKLGYWLNLIVVSIGDIGFILTIMLPGYIGIWPGGLGPLLWIIAAILSTIGRLKH